MLALVSFYFMPTHLWLAGSTYLLSGFLDAFDGWAARKFNQGTMFGAVLDMVTDRFAAVLLLGGGETEVWFGLGVKYILYA